MLIFFSLKNPRFYFQNLTLGLETTILLDQISKQQLIKIAWHINTLLVSTVQPLIPRENQTKIATSPNMVFEIQGINEGNLAHGQWGLFIKLVP